MGFFGDVFGGASAQETAMANDEQGAYQAIQGEQTTQFGAEQEAQKAISSAWSPILSGGAYQYGFSTAEDQQLQKNIEEQGAQATENTIAAQQLREQQMSGGAATMPTGAEEALETQARETGAQATATALGEEKLAGYEQGSKLFEEATAAKEDVAKLADPTAYATAANNAAQTAMQGEQAVQEANANSLTAKLLGGAIEGGLTFATGGLAGLAGGTGFGQGAMSLLSAGKKG